MHTKQGTAFENKMLWLIAEAKALRENFKSEIEWCKDCEIDFDCAVSSLEDALANYTEKDEEENRPMTAAEYKDYWQEEEATTGRED